MFLSFRTSVLSVLGQQFLGLGQLFLSLRTSILVLGQVFYVLKQVLLSFRTSSRASFRTSFFSSRTIVFLC